MRKIIVLSILFLASCSSNDEKTTNVDYVYKISLTSDCPKSSTSVSGTYNVSQTTYERVEQDYSLGSSCYYTSFKDLSNADRKGYVTSVLKCNTCGN